MKLRHIAATFALATVISAPAFAMVSQSDINRRIQSATSGGGNVSVTVRGDTAYLSGRVEDQLSRNAAHRAALATHGIEKVISSVTY